MADIAPQPSDRNPTRPKEYVVVARRYRPQVFDDLIGQEHIARALAGAIATHRVGHAYLFTGARGVGKTSAARILAKALNCVHGPTPTPCNECDICRGITSGEDVDVIEIDGASNRGIDEIRQLRQNVNVRPSRARLKVYIIDEVHMLTREAFNALLKTLEEPPEHVKFIFCTTDPNKVPVTILSRCQRFDFAGIQTGSIARRLGQIVEAEGVEAEPEALEVLARRGAGSMRDAQSLLEQLLSFAPGKITLADVHGMLGTAGDERLARLTDHLVARDAAAALAELDAALDDGVDVALLVEQLFGYLRDCMAAAVGCPSETFLYCSPSTRDQVIASGKALGLHTILAIMQILDQTLARLRQSTLPRVLAEAALVRLCALEDLDELPALVAELRGTAPAQKKTPEPKLGGHSAGATAGLSHSVNSTVELGTAGQASSGTLTLTPETASGLWAQVVSRLSGMLADHAGQAADTAISGPNRLVVSFKSEYTFAKSICERTDNLARLQRILAELTGQVVGIEFRLIESAQPGRSPAAPRRPVSPQQRLVEVADHPMVQRARELFGAEPARVMDPPKPQT